MKSVENLIEIYTDGSCFPNPGTGAWAYVVVENDEMIHSDFGADEYDATNNQMELMAIIKGLEYAYEHLKDRQIVVYSDSQYCVNSITVWFIGWVQKKKLHTKMNTDLIARAYKLYVRTKANIAWVRGHNGNIWNEHADCLCNSEVGRLFKEKNGISLEL